MAVAEGAVSKDDKVLSEEERRRRKDANPYSTISYRIADELEKITSQEARVTVPGHYQRGGPACPYDRVLATRFGTAAARMIMEQKYGCMVGIQGGNIVHVPLEEAASRTKFLPVDHPLIQTARDARHRLRRLKNEAVLFLPTGRLIFCEQNGGRDPGSRPPSFFRSTPLFLHQLGGEVHQRGEKQDAQHPQQVEGRGGEQQGHHDGQGPRGAGGVEHPVVALGG